VELAGAEEVEMEMVHGLAAVFSGVDDNAVALGESLGLGDGGSGLEQMAEEGGLVRAGVVQGGEVLAGNDENVDGRLGMDVGEGVAEVVLMDGGGGDGSLSDLAEEAAHDETSVLAWGQADSMIMLA